MNFPSLPGGIQECYDLYRNSPTEPGLSAALWKIQHTRQCSRIGFTDRQARVVSARKDRLVISGSLTENLLFPSGFVYPLKIVFTTIYRKNSGGAWKVSRESFDFPCSDV
jgi:hypothetical protein